MFRNITPVVKNLLFINLIIHLGLFLLADRIPGLIEWFHLVKLNLFGLHEVGPDGTYLTVVDGVAYRTLTGPSDFRPVQLVSHFFAHSQTSIFHIVMNMLGLIFIGPPVESVLGPRRFLNFYMFSGIFGGILIALFDPSVLPVVGASGAISGILVAFAAFFPDEKMIIFPIPVPIKARNLVIGLAVLSLLLVVFPFGGNISHFGHLAGMIAAVVFFSIRRFIPNL